MRVVVIGGSGHVGTFLVPRLVEAGHGVVAISRGQREPYQVHPAWQSVEQVTLDREAEEAEGTFGERVLGLEPDVVVDMICFTLESARQLVAALRGRISHFLHCGTIWVHGHSTKVPTTEDQTRHPFGEYGVQKARIEAYLLDEARRGGFPATVLHPGHIVGPGWAPVNPAGNFDLTVFERLARGGGDGHPQPRDGDGASRPRRRRGPGFRAVARQLERRGGGELPRRLSGRVDPAWLR